MIIVILNLNMFYIFWVFSISIFKRKVVKRKVTPIKLDVLLVCE